MKVNVYLYGFVVENVVGVILMVLGLNDSFDIEGFEEKK